MLGFRNHGYYDVALFGELRAVGAGEASEGGELFDLFAIEVIQKNLAVMLFYYVGAHGLAHYAEAYESYVHFCHLTPSPCCPMRL